MAEQCEPSAWAAGRFGHELAIALMERIPAALQAAVGRQMDAQQVSKVRTLHAFGGTWPARYEELAAHLVDVPEVHVVRPYGRPVEIVIANNVALMPFEYAKDLRTQIDSRRVLNKLNKMILQLLQRYGPEPINHQPVIDGMPDVHRSEYDDGGPDLLHGLTPDGVVIVFYAADHRAGLLRVGWGEAAVGANREAVWNRYEDLPLPPSASVIGTAVIGTTAIGTAADGVPRQSAHRTTRFDAAPLPTPAISTRPRADQLNLGPLPADRTNEEPLADDNG